MILTRADLLFFKEADLISLGVKRQRPRLFGDDIWKYQIALRHYEYWLCARGLLARIPRFYWRVRYYRFGIRLNFEIPPFTVGPGLSLAHRGPVIVNPSARIGTNCRIHSCVNIGTAAGAQHDAPRIGDNVYLGPGAKLFGSIEVANGIAVAAQAVVNNSFTEPDITVGGIPARKISDKSARPYLIDGVGLAMKNLGYTIYPGNRTSDTA